MADLAAGVIFSIGKKFFRSLKKVKTNKEGARKVKKLINLVNDVLGDVGPLYEDGRIKRDPKVTLVMTRLKCALVEGEKEVDGYLQSNMFMVTVRVDEMADMLVSLRQEIKDLMDVLLHATVDETNRFVKELYTYVMSGGGKQEGGRNNDTRVGCQRPLVLTRNQLRDRQRADTVRVSEALHILPGVAAVLLRNKSWDHERVVNEWWFEDGRKLRAAVGLPLSSKDVSLLRPCKGRERHCNGCRAYGTVISAGCSHYYCKVCWRKHITKAVRTGFQECLSIPCPSCPMPVIEELVGMVPLKEQFRNLYAMSAFSSYVKHSDGRIKWCCGRYCVRAIEFHGVKNVVVACDLGHSFCWSCGKEPHGPLACGAPPRIRSREDRKAAVASSHFMARELGITSVAKLNFLKEAYQVIDKCRIDIKWAHTNHRSHLDQEHLLQKASDSFKILEVLAWAGWFNLYSDRIETEASIDDDAARTAFEKAYKTFKEEVVATTKKTRRKVNKLVEAVKTDL